MKVSGDLKWRLDEWNKLYPTDKTFPPMAKEEIDRAIKALRDNLYPKPEDCPGLDCPNVRPACSLGICQIACGMCGDF